MLQIIGKFSNFEYYVTNHTPCTPLRDNVEWDSEQERVAGERVRENSSEPLPPDRVAELEEQAAQYWHDFYLQHQNRFFKDRHWLFTEFPELKAGSKVEGGGKLTIFEVWHLLLMYSMLC